ncbi:unnamed protein product [marine sediment metagenome]|uniref:Uncharacterized protein n=1 Tax=marine sediment metagenome TaxID=412755 RepID=X1HY38_9ZZZZ
MKRIGYIQGTRIRGPVNLGPGGNLIVPGTLSVSGSMNALEHFTVAYNAIVGNDLTVRGHGNVAYNLIVGNDLTVGGHLGAVRAHIGNGATFTGAIATLTVEDGIVTAAA